MRFNYLILLLTICTNICAQDILYKSNGDSIVANIIKIDETKVEYRYEGENLVNEISLEKLHKITFSSGRTQKFPHVEILQNVGLKASEAIKITNLTNRPISLTLYGIDPSKGTENILAQNVKVNSDAKKETIKVGVYDGRLDHYSAFKIIIESEVEDIRIETEFRHDDIRIIVYARTPIEKQHVSTATQNIVTPPTINGNGEARIKNNGQSLGIKAINTRQNKLTIELRGVINGREKFLSKTSVKQGKECYMPTYTNTKKISEFIFKIIDGEYKNMTYELTDDELILTIE